MPKGTGSKHTACRRGCQVLIKLRNGDKVIDKFIERKGGKIFLQKHAFTKKEMISFKVIKNG